MLYIYTHIDKKLGNKRTNLGLKQLNVEEII